MQIILQPCASPVAKKHLKHTIFNSELKLSSIKPFLNEKDHNNLFQMYRTNQIMIWGVTEPSKTKWERINKGDCVFLSGNGRISKVATITYKIANPELAEFLWGKDEQKRPWKYIYFLDELYNVNIPYETFNKIVGYSVKNVIQGFTVLSQEKSDKLIDFFCLESERYINNILTDEEYKKTIIAQKKQKFNTGVNIEQKTFRRAEQGYLREKLFGNKFTEKCSICGRELPIEFLWCSHIKKRSMCSLEELLDFDNIVTPMCKLGCDDLFEKGFIGVKDGFITILKETYNGTLDSYMKELEGRKCATFSENNKKYYDWHNSNS